MSKPVRTTLIYGLLSAAVIYPVVLALSTKYGMPLAFKLTLWGDLAVYSMLLARWSGTRPIAVAFPLLLLLGAALWPGVGPGFFLLGMAILSWVRSGICFEAPVLRRLTAEVIAVVGGAAMVVAWSPHSALAWALGIWLFFLIQSLYFFIMPDQIRGAGEHQDRDPFEVAMQEAEKVLGG